MEFRLFLLLKTMRAKGTRESVSEKLSSAPDVRLNSTSDLFYFSRAFKRFSRGIYGK